MGRISITAVVPTGHHFFGQVRMRFGYWIIDPPIAFPIIEYFVTERVKAHLVRVNGLLFQYQILRTVFYILEIKIRFLITFRLQPIRKFIVGNHIILLSAQHHLG
ncbi:hypothetical protein D3C85_1075070 [compost metagenome]